MIWAILLGAWLLWCIVIGARMGVRRARYHHHCGGDTFIEVNVNCDQSDNRDQSDNTYHGGR